LGCSSCGRGFHSECEIGCKNCHTTIEQATKVLSLGTGKGAPIKEDGDVNDPLSTGRKRAAIKYPLHKTNPCEWRGKKNCGGGLEPIIGCRDGFQRHRHHGPVKNPLRNEVGNVHRICFHCHTRWHAKNDHVYDETIYEGLPHSPVAATDAELTANEIQWSKHVA